MPTPEPTEAPTPEPTPAVTTLSTAALTCVESESSAADLDAGVIASQLCEPTDEAVGQLTLQTFGEAEELRDAWQTDTETASALTVMADACANETPGADKWGFGNILCGVQDGRAQIRWTDTRSGLIGVVEGADDDVAALYEWWRANARPLGRDPEAEEASKSTTPDKSSKSNQPQRKLVRVPGKPGNATCAASIDPIPDEWGRSWNITKVNFKNESGYERVVLHLERTGKNRSKNPTQTTVSRVTVKNLRSEYPKAPKPTKGKLAVVLGIDGINDAPTLYNYKPSSLDYIKQLSIFKSSGGYTAVIATPAAICYQVRIPVWSKAATGNEQRGQIYIDFKPR